MYTFGHWNGSESGWVESGPYIHGWHTTREDAERAMKLWRTENPSTGDGWYNRVAVMSEEEYQMMS